MELIELNRNLYELVERNRIKQVFELLKEEVHEESDKRKNLSLLKRRYNTYLDKKLTNTISTKKSDVEISKISSDLTLFISGLEQHDLGTEIIYRNHEITNQILVYTKKSELDTIKDFFLQLNFVNVDVRDYSANNGSVNDYDLVIFDNQDLPVCANEKDLDRLETFSQTLILSRIDKMELTIKKYSKLIIHFGDRLFWINKNRNTTQSANSKFSLHARTKEVIEFINTYRV